MRKVYDSIVAQLRAQIFEQRLASARERMNTDDGEELAGDADKTMSLTRMKEKKIATVKREQAVKDRRILEYIKYLIG